MKSLPSTLSRATRRRLLAQPCRYILPPDVLSGWGTCVSHGEEKFHGGRSQITRRYRCQHTEAEHPVKRVYPFVTESERLPRWLCTLHLQQAQRERALLILLRTERAVMLAAALAGMAPEAHDHAGAMDLAALAGQVTAD